MIRCQYVLTLTGLPLALIPLVTICTSNASAVTDSKPPNIVLIISDDQSYTDYSFMGHPSIETPRN